MTTEVFVIITALIIVITRMTLGYMEDKDRARGLPVNHREYTFSGILGIMLTERLDAFKSRMKKLFTRGSKTNGERKNRGNKKS